MEGGVDDCSGVVRGVRLRSVRSQHGNHVPARKRYANERWKAASTLPAKHSIRIQQTKKFVCISWDHHRHTQHLWRLRDECTGVGPHNHYRYRQIDADCTINRQRPQTQERYGRMLTAVSVDTLCDECMMSSPLETHCS